MPDLEPKQITVKSYTPVKPGVKIGTLEFICNGMDYKYMAYENDNWARGQDRTVYFTEKYSDYKKGNEWWVSTPKERQPASTAGIGARRSNPGTGTTRDDFLGKWDKDREAKTITDSSIVAQVITKIAGEMEISRSARMGEEPNPNNMAAYAQDMVAIYQDTQSKIFNYLKGFTKEES